VPVDLLLPVVCLLVVFLVAISCNSLS